jgi:DNA (cytosine-5)-methyltransferase 1
MRSTATPSHRLRAIDLFCGVGGFSLGFENAGIEVVAAFDKDARNVSVYSENFPKTKCFTLDLSETSGKQVLKLAAVPEIDILFGGPPCQGFSLIGRRQSEDPRNTLIHRFCELVIQIKPKFFVFENVEGLLQGSARYLLADCLRLLRSNNYHFRSPIQVLDASLFGVAQRRRRVFVIGCQAELPLPSYPNPRKSPPPTVWDVISDLHACRRLPSAQGLTGTETSQHTAAIIERFANTSPGALEPVSRFYRLKKDGLCNTLRAGTDESRGSHTAARPIHPVEPRCISVREAARLHSYPDSFKFHPTIWHGFRQVGNSVPPKLAQAVGRTVIQAYARSATEHSKR